jgi:hypothetical protein
VDRGLSGLVAAVRTDANLVSPMLDAARAEATLGEISGALHSVLHLYASVSREPVPARRSRFPNDHMAVETRTNPIEQRDATRLKCSAVYVGYI